MPLTTGPEWQTLALYAVAAAVILTLLQRIPVVGRVIRAAISLAALAFLIFVLLQQAPYHPSLARLTERFGIDKQQVVGDELRVRMSADGHFWVNATINGVERRMLIDSGATITALSDRTAREASIEAGSGLTPIVLKTANGMAPAGTGTIDELRIGNILARNLKIVTSPGLGEMDVVGMNFLSQLESWRVEGQTLVLVPHHPQAVARS